MLAGLYTVTKSVTNYADAGEYRAAVTKSVTKLRGTEGNGINVCGQFSVPVG